MQTSYHTKDNHVYQKVMIRIDKTPENIFPSLGTTKGIQKWFPELSFKGTERMLFQLEKDVFEEMDILRYENPNFIHFTWADGEVEILLEAQEEGSQLVLNERLPVSFEHAARDFAGWQFKVKSIKDIAEDREAPEMDEQQFEAIQKEIEKKLNLYNKG